MTISHLLAASLLTSSVWISSTVALSSTPALVDASAPAVISFNGEPRLTVVADDPAPDDVLDLARTITSSRKAASKVLFVTSLLLGAVWLIRLGARRWADATTKFGQVCALLSTPRAIAALSLAGGVLGSVVSSLKAGTPVDVDALLQGGLSGALASGIWSNGESLLKNGKKKTVEGSSDAAS